MRRAIYCSLALLSLNSWSSARAADQPPAWFADGYHGGSYGHYPTSFTRFMVDSLQRYPEWKLNLEIEPETWDAARRDTPQDYAEFQTLAADQSVNGRIEFVNPAYGQAYFWNISGESVIQQLDRGLVKLREHFPGARLTTYCSEEPCFTSALPGLLRSFGFQNAVLKNPNTCWGGYTRAFGGELVNWVGPDGTGIVTVPRYAIESLVPERTWETIANANSTDYLRATREAGIQHPVGMCLQDAGWRFGPWLKEKQGTYQPSEYTTWRNYFARVATNEPTSDWRLSQEDIQVSLVWGAQVLQRIAQQVRIAENRLIRAEKLAAMADALAGAAWPAQDFDAAWRTLLLAQHHDCWIVPYNGRGNDTWADKVARWTAGTRETADRIANRATLQLTAPTTNESILPLVVFNTLASARRELVAVSLPDRWRGAGLRVLDSLGAAVPSQSAGDNEAQLAFIASAPALGFATYRVERGRQGEAKGASAAMDSAGLVVAETDLYRIEVDPNQGGTIRSWIAKTIGNRELVEPRAGRKFNEIRGYFFDRAQFCATTDQPATIEIVERGPVRVRLKINAAVAASPVTQWITLVQGEPRIDFQVRIDWQGNPRIGSAFEQAHGFRREHNRKAFYEDGFKLLAHFPLKLRRQQVSKDAPFDITQSRLTDTRFDSWSDLKNNVILHWVDVFDPDDKLGVALLTDHTGNYVHGPDFPLALTLQYAGIGLWGRDYTVRGSTEICYGLLPHAGDVVAADIWRQGNAWCEPLVVQSRRGVTPSNSTGKSLLTIDRPGWEVPAIHGGASNTVIRLFNASADAAERSICYGAAASKVELVELDGRLIRTMDLRRDGSGRVSFTLTLPRFGVATLRITP